MGVLFTLFSFLVRWIFRPFLEALEKELKWSPPKEWDLSDDVRHKLEKVTKERVETILSDKLSAEVFELKAIVATLQDEVAELHIRTRMHGKRSVRLTYAANSTYTRIGIVEKELQSIDRVRRVKNKENDSRGVPGEATVEDIEWG